MSTARGGPWTPRFRNLFKKAGMELKDPEDIVPVKGHAGPHPERYHRIIYQELEAATRGCRTVENCRRALRAMLAKLGREVSTPGTELNLLVAQTPLR
ncbi:AHH domain-containing protein [Myxococcus sp. K15C18031901]|nr:AHH domain-containing protein [Myxococcus dinghuensis]